MNKHQDTSILCLFATQSQQGSPLLNILSLVVRAVNKLHILDSTHTKKICRFEKLWNIPHWNMSLMQGVKKEQLFRFGIFRLDSPKNEVCSRVLL